MNVLRRNIHINTRYINVYIYVASRYMLLYITYNVYIHIMYRDTTYINT